MSEVEVLDRPLPLQERRMLLEKELRSNPDRSNRELGRIVGVDHKTIAVWRDRMVSADLKQNVSENETEGFKGGNNTAAPAREAITAPLIPPAATAPVILARRRKLEAERDALRAGLADLALRSAKGDAAAQTELRAIPEKLAGLQFEIDQNFSAHELAVKQDSDAEIRWRSSLQDLAPEVLLAGLTAENCPGACQPGIAGGCVLAGGAPYAGSTCHHPVRFGSFHQFCVDDAGKRIFQHQYHPQAALVFSAAIHKLKVRGKFA